MPILYAHKLLIGSSSADENRAYKAAEEDVPRPDAVITAAPGEADGHLQLLGTFAGALHKLFQVPGVCVSHGPHDKSTIIL
jgi:hypothetical protein